MSKFIQHNQNTAPEASQPTLKSAQQMYGFVPNLMATLAESPAAVEGYAALSGIFDKSDLTAAEKQVVLMTNNYLNNCTYCMAAHSTISQIQGVSDDVIQTLRNGTSFADEKLEALRVFTIKINQNRGVVSDDDINQFLSAGYSKANVLEVILGTGLKVLSNYSNHIAETPVDEAFSANVLSAEKASAA